jgi:hypothetical protein
MSNSTFCPFIEAAVAADGDRAEVHEHVRATTVRRDQAVALIAVEHFTVPCAILTFSAAAAPPDAAAGVRASCDYSGQPVTSGAGV